ncbi:MAG: hypothetical protein P8Y44_07680 [Acidobacteriota bacterium]
MSLWIGVESSSEGRQLRVEGRLSGEEIAELEQVARSPELPVRVDLSQLDSADEAGIALLRNLESEGVELVGVRPLIEYRIHESRGKVRSEP